MTPIKENHLGLIKTYINAANLLLTDLDKQLDSSIDTGAISKAGFDTHMRLHTLRASYQDIEVVMDTLRTSESRS